jgi:hypothetical protein
MFDRFVRLVAQYITSDMYFLVELFVKYLL